MTKPENSIFGWMVGTIVVVFVGMIFLISTMTGFLPYREQTKQSEIWANAQVETAQIQADKEVTLAEISMQKEPVAVMSNIIYYGILTFLFVLVLFAVTIRVLTL